MVKKIFKSYEDAKTYLKKLGFKKRAQYLEWASSSKKPQDIPYNPITTYKEWVSWADYLGYFDKTNYI